MKLLDSKSFVLAAILSFSSFSFYTAPVVNDDANLASGAEHYSVDFNAITTSFSDYILLTFTRPKELSEPESLGMMLAGLGLIGFIAKRRFS